MKKIVISLAVCTSLLLAANVEKTKAEKEKIITHTELGFIQTQGNTDTTKFSLDLDIKKAWGKNNLKLSADVQYAVDSGDETNNKYIAELEYGYAVKDNLFITYILGYKNDKFSGYDYQIYTGPGLKYTAIETQKHTLNIEGSILYSKDDNKNIQYDASGNIISYPNSDNVAVAYTTYGEIEDYSSYRVKAVYNWQILENLKFDQELSYRSNFEDSSVSFIYSKTALSSKLSKIFSAGISYKVDYTNSPQAGKEYTDRTFVANLIIDY